MSHTPKPWVVSKSGRVVYAGPITITQIVGPSAASMYSLDEAIGEAIQANSKLIAAAPELLEVLAELQNSIDAYIAVRKPEDEWDEYDHAMCPIWRKALALLDRFDLNTQKPK